MSTVPQESIEGLNSVLPSDHPQISPSKWRRFPELVSLDPKVVFLGDSVLDDSYWLRDRTRPLRKVLEEKLSEEEELKNYKVINFAVDCMKTYDFLKRSPMESSWERFETARRVSAKNKEDVNPMDATYEYCVAEDGNIYSIENLKALREVKCVVVSIGGNDTLRKASNFAKLIGSVIPYFRVWRHLFASDFNQRLRTILQEIRKAAPQALIIPVIFYHPHYELVPVAGPLLKPVVKTFLKDILTPMSRSYLFVAQTMRLPVIDLSQTFSPDNIRHYGTMDKKLKDRTWSGIEPSDVSQAFIADLVRHVLLNYNPADGSTVYYGHANGDTLEKIVSVQNTQQYAETFVFGRGGKVEHTHSTESI